MSDNTRKPRKTVTLELFEITKRFLEDERLSIKEIVSRTDLSTKRIRNLKKILMDIPFTPRREKVKITSELRNEHFSEIETRNHHELSMDNSLTLRDIKNKLEADNVSSSKSTISKKIKKIGLTRKSLTRILDERNTHENIEVRAIFANKMLRLGVQNLIFLDETGFNNHLQKYYGYSPVNTKAHKMVPGNKGGNVSSLAVIGIGGL